MLKSTINTRNFISWQIFQSHLIRTLIRLLICLKLVAELNLILRFRFYLFKIISQTVIYFIMLIACTQSDFSEFTPELSYASNELVKRDDKIHLCCKRNSWFPINYFVNAFLRRIFIFAKTIQSNSNRMVNIFRGTIVYNNIIRCRSFDITASMKF